MRKLGLVLVTATLSIGITVAGQGVSGAEGATRQHGPDPTNASIEAERGPFDVAQDTVARGAANGFGGGTIYYPSSTEEGKFGAVAIAPGFTASQSSMAWLGPRLASQGFVVFTIDTLTTSDQPDARGDQLRAALRYLTSESKEKDRIDGARLATMGHSMGGGGTLEATKDDPALRASIPLTPWDLNKNFSGVKTPTMIIGGQSDTIAPVASHSESFYRSLPNTTNKAYLELRGASHFAPNISNTTIAKYSISWLKRFVDDDRRYDQFLCPAPGASAEISQYQSTCPY